MRYGDDILTHICVTIIADKLHRDRCNTLIKKKNLTQNVPSQGPAPPLSSVTTCWPIGIKSEAVCLRFP